MRIYDLDEGAYAYTHSNRTRQTVVDNGETVLLVSTCDVSHIEDYPYETGVFHTLANDGYTLNGAIEAPNHARKVFMRGDNIAEALDTHIEGIMLAVDYLEGRDV